MLKRAIRTLKNNPIMVPLLFLIDFVLFATDLLATIGKRKINPNKICILKLDKIGDYILLRNFILDLRNHERFNKCQITFIGNSQNKPFIEFLDKGAFNDFIWIDIYKYSSSLFYRYRISRQIYKEGFHMTLVPTYARVLVLDDFIAFATRAQVTIGQTAHLINIKRWERSIGNRFYTELIDLHDTILFEFERNRLFFQAITRADLSYIQLHIQPPKYNLPFFGKYVALIPGAGDQFRQWSPTNFTKLIDYLISKINVDVILCGSPIEKDIGTQIVINSKHPDKIRNEVGALGIAELFNTYHHASFIVTNETGAVHIGAAMNKLVFVISNGNHFKKYTEYPASLGKNIHYIYPKEVDDLMPNYDHIASKFDLKSNLDINTIPVEKVIARITTIF